VWENEIPPYMVIEYEKVVKKELEIFQKTELSPILFCVSNRRFPLLVGDADYGFERF
jgi:hypothetical protein